jgi:hypothetical protein
LGADILDNAVQKENSKNLERVLFSFIILMSCEIVEKMLDELGFKI